MTSAAIPRRPAAYSAAPAPALQLLLETLDDALRRVLGVSAGDRLLVAFSGGPDSTALLLAASRLAPSSGFELGAAHADHGLDPGAARRAARAARLAAGLGVPLTVVRLDPASIRGHRRGLEAGAREARYRGLLALASSLGARYLLTGHHAGDQAETVALRLLFGSGLSGLGAMATRRGAIARPFLALPQSRLRAAVAESGLEPVDDPTNRDPSRPRNRLRHHLLPRLAAGEPQLLERLAGVAAAARRADRALARRLHLALQPRCEDDGAVAVERAALSALPPSLLPPALALLGRLAGSPHAPTAAARRELERQLAGGGRVGCDCGGGWRLAGDSILRLTAPRAPVGHFSYTVPVPGRVAIEPLGLRLHLHRGPVAPWMLRCEPRRAGLAAALDAGSRVVVRNRRPGDRLRPLGSPGQRRLKDLLIDRRIPRHRRDRLPLLVIDGEIAWVPGVAIAHHLRLRGGATTAWIVELEGTPAGGGDEDRRSPAASFPV